jgi:hypothetical protein
MRSLWNTLSFLAVVHLLALLIAVGWLWQSGRLTRERVQDVRQMLSTSVREAHSSAVKLATQAEAERLRQQEEEVRRHPPADSATQIRQIALVHEQQDRARTRLEDERRMLSDQLAQATARLEANAEQLREQRASMQKGIKA